MLPTEINQALRLISPLPRRGLEYAIKGYLVDCQVRSLAARTLAIYRHHLEALLAWAEPK